MLDLSDARQDYLAYQIQIKVLDGKLNIHATKNGKPVYDCFWDKQGSQKPLPYYIKTTIIAEDGWVAIEPTFCGYGKISSRNSTHEVPAIDLCRASFECHCKQTFNALRDNNILAHIRIACFEIKEILSQTDDYAGIPMFN